MVRTQAVPAGPPSLGLNTLALFVDRIRANQDPTILDLGPVSNHNLNYLAGELGLKVQVYDLHREAGGDLRSAVERLTPPSRTFHGVLVWDLIDYLEEKQARSLVGKLGRAVKPGGAVQALFGQGSDSTVRLKQYLIESKTALRVRETSLSAPRRTWPNREIQELFNGFETLHSFIHNTGLREFILRRPQAPLAEKSRFGA